MIYAGVEVSRKEGEKKLSVICVEVMVYGTRGNEGTERSGVHDEESWTKDRALGTAQEEVCQQDRSTGRLVPAHLRSPGQRAVKCVCVCV